MGTIDFELLGEIDTTLFVGSFGVLRTAEVIITEERIAHIKEHHPDDYCLFKTYGKTALFTPDRLIQDIVHPGTVFAVKRMPETNLNVVLRLALAEDGPAYKNSVMTFYRIRNRNLEKLIAKHKLLYKRE